MGIFSSKQSKRRSGGAHTPDSRVTEADKAVLKLKTQRRKLTDERTRLEGLIVKGVADARRYIQAQQRERALLYLRKNKMHDRNIKTIGDYLINVEQVLSNMEAAQRNNRLFAALKEGNTALQELQKQVALEDVERLNEETEEAREYQEQLRELLGQTLSAQDDAEALEELERIEVAQEQDEAIKLPKVPSIPATPDQTQEDILPEVPKHEVPSKQKPLHPQQGRQKTAQLA